MGSSKNKQVVSANYNERDSQFKWLIRGVKEEHENARAFKTVMATGITFMPADEIENGRGCSVVALCKKAIGSNEPQEVNLETANELVYCGFGFFDLKTDEEVTKIDRLYLDEKGKIWDLAAVEELASV